MDDVLQVNWPALSAAKDGRLSIVGNLPFHITSQILFCLIDCIQYVEKAVVTVQKEVAERVVAKPRTPQYSALSVVFGIYTSATKRFNIPSDVFYPKPDVTASLLELSFGDGTFQPDVNPLLLKRVVKSAFSQKRKMLRHSLKDIAPQSSVLRDSKWGQFRPEMLAPKEFVTLTKVLFGCWSGPNPSRVWRKCTHGDY
eukprot:GHVN01043995.1.p1 GENE.GHVN01043995.1~~GHVN01043995.1.p1  ORF type:complete len:198 (+),score=14.81 GHVN01043995.1:676-1269(+)